MYIGRIKNGSSEHYGGYHLDQIKRTLHLSRFIIPPSIVSIGYFMYQDLYMVDLKVLFWFQLILAIPLLLYAGYCLGVREKKPGILEGLHSGFLTGIMGMSVGINLYVHEYINHQSSLANELLISMIFCMLFVFALAAVSMHWLPLIIGVPYGIYVSALVIFFPHTIRDLLIYHSTSMLTAVVLIFLAFYKEYSKFDDYVVRKNLDEELARNQLMTEQLKQMLAEKQELAERMEFHAMHDNLTRAYNRGAGLDILKNDMDYCQRNNAILSVVFVDVDGLKLVNDLHGHDAGDILLVTVVNGLRHAMRSYDYIIRMGGDEFLVVLRDCDPPAAAMVITRVQQELDTVEDNRFKPQFSFGISRFGPDSWATVDDLIHYADVAMYEDKNLKKQKVSGLRT